MKQELEVIKEVTNELTFIQSTRNANIKIVIELPERELVELYKEIDSMIYQRYFTSQNSTLKEHEHRINGITVITRVKNGK